MVHISGRRGVVRKTFYFKRFYTEVQSEATGGFLWIPRTEWHGIEKKKTLSNPHPPISVRLVFQHWYTRRVSWVCVFSSALHDYTASRPLLNPNHDQPRHSSKRVVLAKRFRTAGPYHLSAEVVLGKIDLDQGFSNGKLNSMETSVFMEDLLRRL